MSRLYGIVDAARDPRLYPLIIQSPYYECLLAGEIADPLRPAAPYLVDLSDEAPLKSVWRSEGQGKAWGILVRSSLDRHKLRQHLRKFLLAELPDGKVVFFRFYDPRVWRTYWPTCSPEQKALWKQGIEEIVAESG